MARRRRDARNIVVVTDDEMRDEIAPSRLLMFFVHFDELVSRTIFECLGFSKNPSFISVP